MLTGFTGVHPALRQIMRGERREAVSRDSVHTVQIFLTQGHLDASSNAPVLFSHFLRLLFSLHAYV